MQDFPAVLPLPRQLPYFGGELELRRLTALQFMPDVFAFIATGVRIRRQIQEKHYATHLALTALERSVTKGGALRKSTQAVLLPLFQEALGEPVELEQLAGLSPHRLSPYRMAFRARQRRPKVLRRILVRLAAETRHAIELDRAFGAPGHTARYAQTMGPSVATWHELISADAAIHLDRMLMHIAWTERDLRRYGSPAQVRPLTELADPHQHPMRNWFDGLLMQTLCKNLVEFEQLLAARGVYVPEQSLRHYASGTQSLAHKRAMEIIRACGMRVHYETERLRFWSARLIIFAQELLQALPANPPDLERARACVYRRLVRLGEGPASRLL